jgi:hypothetical protein
MLINPLEILDHYEIVQTIKEAEYWIAYRDDRRDFLRGSITPFKAYKIELLPDNFRGKDGVIIEDEEYFFKDDKGQYCMDYMIHKGDFLRKIVNT